MAYGISTCGNPSMQLLTIRIVACVGLGSHQILDSGEGFHEFTQLLRNVNPKHVMRKAYFEHVMRKAYFEHVMRKVCRQGCWKSSRIYCAVFILATHTCGAG